MPCSGAAIAPDGRLFLVEVDGRQPELSVGVTRREFSALMRSLGATEGLLFDGGGSSTIVVRRLGDTVADVVNSPSDGKERPVADGLFVYSSAPAGPAVRLVARPSIVRAIGGAQVSMRVAAVDAAYHVAGTDERLQRDRFALAARRVSQRRVRRAPPGQRSFTAARRWAQGRRTDRGRCDAGAQQDHAGPAERRSRCDRSH